MKKILLAALLSCLAVISARADLLWYESFNYVDGCIETNSSGLWIAHSPSPTPQFDALVTNKKLESSYLRQDDIHRFYSSPATDSVQTLYASLTINVASVPGGNGAYLAHFYNNETNFYGKIWVLAGNPGGDSNVFSALPGTYRLGVSSGGVQAPNKIFPVDLATNSDYQVVISYDPVQQFSTMWVNPISVNDLSLQTSDIVTNPVVPLTGFAFRQASTVGGTFFSTFTNLSGATTYDEAATNVWKTNAVAPTIPIQPLGFTNFVGVSNNMFLVANGQGLGTSLRYIWKKGTGVITNPDGNTNVLQFPNPQTGDSGDYTVIVSNAVSSLTVTSAVATVLVTFGTIPPIITQQPATNVTVYLNQNASLSVAATGPGPISYQWNFQGNPVSGATGTSLSIVKVHPTNSNIGLYECDVYNQYGTNASSNAFVTAISPPVTNIAYLRTLTDPTFFLPNNTTSYWTATGVVFSKTNFTSAGNDEFFMSDGTGSICVFVGGGATVRPRIGDSVTVVGSLTNFNSLTELSLSATDPSKSIVTNSSGNTLPIPTVLPFSFTNSVAYGGISNALRLYQGAYVTFTNVYFPLGFTSNKFTATSFVMTNVNAERFTCFIPSAFSEMIGTTIPKFAWSITAPMTFFLSTGAANRSAGYEIAPAQPADFVITPPPLVATVTKVAGQPVITWPAQPYDLSYSILRSIGDVTGPYTSIASGLIFTTTSGTYTDNDINTTNRYYRISTP